MDSASLVYDALVTLTGPNTLTTLDLDGSNTVLHVHRTTDVLCAGDNGLPRPVRIVGDRCPGLLREVLGLWREVSLSPFLPERRSHLAYRGERWCLRGRDCG